MIDLKPLKNESRKFEEPLKSIMEMAKDKMPEQDFVEFFLSLRRKAREIDNIKRDKQ